jgi:hypothetical protein
MVDLRKRVFAVGTMTEEQLKTELDKHLSHFTEQMFLLACAGLSIGIDEENFKELAKKSIARAIEWSNIE